MGVNPVTVNVLIWPGAIPDEVNATLKSPEFPVETCNVKDVLEPGMPVTLLRPALRVTDAEVENILKPTTPGDWAVV